MRYVAPNEVNSILALVYSGARVKLINEKEFKEEDEISLDFGDFLRSQLVNKIVRCDYKNLICSVIHIRKTMTTGISLTSEMYADIRPVYNEFIRVGSLAAMYMHLRYGIKLNLTLTRELEEYTTSDIDETDKRILIYEVNSIVNDFSLYEEMLLDNNLILLKYGEVDQEYLTRILIGYNYAMEGVNAVWKGGIL